MILVGANPRLIRHVLENTSEYFWIVFGKSRENLAVKAYVGLFKIADELGV